MQTSHGTNYRIMQSPIANTIAVQMLITAGRGGKALPCTGVEGMATPGFLVGEMLAA